MNSSDFYSEENESGAWREMLIAWDAGDTFAPSIMRGPVKPRLLSWSGNDVQWLNPLLKSGETTVIWSGSLNFSSDPQ